MVFSTHRFGNLTRHADLILYVHASFYLGCEFSEPMAGHRYMNDSLILETGSHEELMKLEDSEYARLWRMQAEAFL
jgi:hypothetical protein